MYTFSIKTNEVIQAWFQGHKTEAEDTRALIVRLYCRLDQFGNNFMVTQSVPKELRDNDPEAKGPILGNGRCVRNVVPPEGTTIVARLLAGRIKREGLIFSKKTNAKTILGCFVALAPEGSAAKYLVYQQSADDALMGVMGDVIGSAQEYAPRASGWSGSSGSSPAMADDGYPVGDYPF